MNKPYVTYARCETKESFEMNKNKYPNNYQVIPAEIYVDKEGICLVTSQEWCDWLCGKRDDIPNSICMKG